MKNREENKLSMYYAVKQVCNDHSGIWAGLPAFVMAFSEFEAKLDLLEEAVELQDTAITGHTKNKRAIEDAMVDLAVAIAKKVFAYAEDQHDTVLQDMVNYSRSDLKDARDSLTLQRGQIIYDAALPVVGALGAYGVIGSDLAQLQTLIDDFGDIIADPRAAITEHKGATADIGRLEGEIDVILNKRMDPLTEHFRNTHRKYYKQYFDARIIIDRGVRHTALDGVVTDSATGNPIAGALVELVGHEDSVETDAEGRYGFDKIKATGDTLRVSKAGWVTKEVAVLPKRGKHVEVNVGLDAATEIPEETEEI